MQGRRPEGAPDNVQPASNASQPQEPTAGELKPLITSNWGPVVGAAITAAASLLLYSFQQIRHIDERLDLLERKAASLLDGTGVIKPSREALENKYHLEALQRRVNRLEDN